MIWRCFSTLAVTLSSEKLIIFHILNLTAKCLSPLLVIFLIHSSQGGDRSSLTWTLDWTWYRRLGGRQEANTNGPFKSQLIASSRYSSHSSSWRLKLNFFLKFVSQVYCDMFRSSSIRCQAAFFIFHFVIFISKNTHIYNRTDGQHVYYVNYETL